MMVVRAGERVRWIRRRTVNIAGTALTIVAVVLAVIPLGAMLAWVVAQGASSLDLNFFTQLPKPTGETGGGMLNAITGTIELIVLASIIGIPIGIFSGMYLAEAGANGFAHAVRFVTDVIAGTPSIVAGIIVYALVVLPFGFSALSGGIALALLMFPTVGRASEEAIRLVPISAREAGLALGIPEWKTMLRITLPAAVGGMVTAAMLGIARVAGETAPLLFTSFGSPQVQLSPNQPVEALPLQIWYYATSPYADWHRQAWAGALVLFALILVLNLAARLAAHRLTVSAGHT